VLLKATDASDLMVLLLGNQRNTSHIEFGAHQVVLCRNDAARQNLPEELKVIDYIICYIYCYYSTQHTVTAHCTSLHKVAFSSTPTYVTVCGPNNYSVFWQ
jgi:hypothetical protein